MAPINSTTTRKFHLCLCSIRNSSSRPSTACLQESMPHRPGILRCPKQPVNAILSISIVCKSPRRHYSDCMCDTQLVICAAPLQAPQHLRLDAHLTCNFATPQLVQARNSSDQTTSSCSRGCCLQSSELSLPCICRPIDRKSLTRRLHSITNPKPEDKKLIRSFLGTVLKYTASGLVFYTVASFAAGRGHHLQSDAAAFGACPSHPPLAYFTPVSLHCSSDHHALPPPSIQP